MKNQDRSERSTSTDEMLPERNPDRSEMEAMIEGLSELEERKRREGRWPPPKSSELRKKDPEGGMRSPSPDALKPASPSLGPDNPDNQIIDALIQGTRAARKELEREGKAPKPR